MSDTTERGGVMGGDAPTPIMCRCGHDIGIHEADTGAEGSEDGPCWDGGCPCEGFEERPTPDPRVPAMAAAFASRASFLAMLGGTEETPDSVARWLLAALDASPDLIVTTPAGIAEALIRAGWATAETHGKPFGAEYEAGILVSALRDTAP